ncbi:hypothetical protein DW064_10430 [Segatella copri]|uniref:Uncharacterized protein n=1 Tax=Segatella copri TaxID=165179 RepID=A0AA92WJT7_9BACT|nr:hypothetical protein DW064_10430 [Segatella copri]
MQSARQAWTYLLCRKVKIIIWNKQRFWGFFLVVYQKMSSFVLENLLFFDGIIREREIGVNGKLKS